MKLDFKNIDGINLMQYCNFNHGEHNRINNISIQVGHDEYDGIKHVEIKKKNKPLHPWPKPIYLVGLRGTTRPSSSLNKRS